MAGEGAVCGRATSPAFLRRQADLPADVQQLLGCARLLSHSMLDDRNAGLLPPAQHKALLLLETAIDRFISPATTSPPGTRPPGVGKQPAAATAEATRA